MCANFCGQCTHVSGCEISLIHMMWEASFHMTACLECQGAQARKASRGDFLSWQRWGMAVGVVSLSNWRKAMGLPGL